MREQGRRKTGAGSRSSKFAKRANSALYEVKTGCASLKIAAGDFPHRKQTSRDGGVYQAKGMSQGSSEIRRAKTARIPWIKETEPLGMTLVLSKVNMRSVVRIPPLKS